MAAGGYCSICRTRYRGTWGAHASTKRHRANAYRQANPASSTRKGHKRLAREAAGRRARRVERAPSGRPIRVRAHRRRTPEDGPRRRVDVVRHRRGRPFVHERREYSDARGRRVVESFSVRGHLLTRRRWLK
jgi:hypothetical protein